MNTHDSLSRALRLSAGRAREQGVPQSAIEDAIIATQSGLGRNRAPVPPHRVSAYFEGCIRRTLLREHGGTTAAARIVADAIVADLAGAGRSRHAIARELERGWSRCLPAEVLEEYKAALCA